MLIMTIQAQGHCDDETYVEFVSPRRAAQVLKRAGGETLRLSHGILSTFENALGGPTTICITKDHERTND